MTLPTHLESTFNGSGGIRLFRQSWLPGEPAAGVSEFHSHPAEPRSLRLSVMLQI